MLLSFSIELYPYPNFGVCVFVISLLASVCLFVGFSQYLSLLVFLCLSVCLSISLTNIKTRTYTHITHTHINIFCVNFLVFVCTSAIFPLFMILAATMFVSFFSFSLDVCNL